MFYCSFSHLFRALSIIIFVSPFFAARCLAEAKIYVYKERDGAIRFSSKPPPSGTQAKIFKGRESGFSWYRGGVRSSYSPKLFKERYESIIAAASKRYGIPSSFVKAVIHAESAFNPRAVSPKGAQGLMQIMPFHHRRLGIRDPFDPQQNIFGGVRMLAELKIKYKGEAKLMLAAYNAGEEAVSRYGGIPPYRETQGYVVKVLQLQKRYANEQKSS